MCTCDLIQIQLTHHTTSEHVYLDSTNKHYEQLNNKLVFQHFVSHNIVTGVSYYYYSVDGRLDRTSSVESLSGASSAGSPRRSSHCHRSEGSGTGSPQSLHLTQQCTCIFPDTCVQINEIMSIFGFISLVNVR
jgi:hypothetical protein